jgi:hypothetical protein
MSDFDNGLAVGYVIGKKQGGGSGPCPPCEYTPDFRVAYFLNETPTYAGDKIKSFQAPTAIQPSFEYLVEDI